MHEKQSERTNLEQGLNQALQLESEGRFIEEKEVLEDLLFRFPDHPAVLTCLSINARFLNNIYQAIEYARRAVRLSPKSGHASTSFYYALMADDRTEEAFDEIVRFWELTQNWHYDGIISELRKHSGNLTHSELHNFFLRLQKIGYICGKESNNLSADSPVLAHVKGLPTQNFDSHTIDAYQELALKYIETKDFDSAEELLKKALALDPNDAWTQLYLANIRFNRKEYTAALGEFKRLSHELPGSGAPLWAMGQVYFAMGDIDEANQAFLDAVRVEPSSAIVRRQLRRWLDELDRIYVDD